MMARQCGHSSRWLGMPFGLGSCSGLTDAELIDQFTRSRDEASELAFTVLVERHGPIVLHVCRRVLSDHGAAEDAFQATFLVLARRAASIAKHESLGSWLYGVAYRVASSSRAASARRRAAGAQRLRPTRFAARAGGTARARRARSVRDRRGTCPAARAVPRGSFALLRGRTDLRGGCSQARLASRHGQESPGAGVAHRLRERLTRRGLAPTAFGVATLPAAKPLPPYLAVVTARAVAHFCTGDMAAVGYPSAAIVALTREVLKSMLLKTMTLVGTVLAASALVAAGAAGFAPGAPTGPGEPPPPAMPTTASDPRRTDGMAEAMNRVNTAAGMFGRLAGVREDVEKAYKHLEAVSSNPTNREAARLLRDHLLLGRGRPRDHPQQCRPDRRRSSSRDQAYALDAATDRRGEARRPRPETARSREEARRATRHRSKAN